jgi:hypothetical protein
LAPVLLTELEEWEKQQKKEKEKEEDERIEMQLLQKNENRHYADIIPLN